MRKGTKLNRLMKILYCEDLPKTLLISLIVNQSVRLTIQFLKKVEDPDKLRVRRAAKEPDQ